MAASGGNERSNYISEWSRYSQKRRWNDILIYRAWNEKRILSLRRKRERHNIWLFVFHCCNLEKWVLIDSILSDMSNTDNESRNASSWSGSPAPKQSTRALLLRKRIVVIIERNDDVAVRNSTPTAEGENMLEKAKGRERRIIAERAMARGYFAR